MSNLYYPSQDAVQRCIQSHSPLLLLVSFDGQQLILSDLDESPEHSILLSQLGMNYRDIDKYFRLVLDDSGADWTFVCPPDYKSIPDKRRRITQFYLDGFSAISQALQSLGLLIGIHIPRRYNRNTLQALKCL